jgi:pimeloyl-ACP methyl ester carboxylesterase
VTRTATALDGIPVQRVALPRGELAVVEAGSASSGGTPVVFVPGYTGSKEDFGPLLRPLARDGFHVFAYDQRGQFESPAVPGRAHTPTALAHDLLDLLGALNLPRVHLVGHSLGGLVARAAAISTPAAFASVVLMDSGPAALPPGQRVSAMRQLRPTLIASGVAAIWTVYEAIGPTTEFARRRFLAHDPQAMLEMGDALLVEPDRTRELSEICRAAGLPVLVLCGENDDAWAPALQQDMATRLGAAFVSIIGAAHSPAMEQPAATVTALTEFWRKTETAQTSGEDSVTTS